MSNKLSQLVKDIKYKTDKTIEQIAESIGYSRVHLGREMKKEESPAIEELLNEKYRDVLQIETSYTDKRRNLKNTKDATKLLAVREGAPVPCTYDKMPR